MSEKCFACEAPIIEGICICNAPWPWPCPGCQEPIGSPCLPGCSEDERRLNREDDELRFNEKYDDDPDPDDEPAEDTDADDT